VLDFGWDQFMKKEGRATYKVWETSAMRRCLSAQGFVEKGMQKRKKKRRIAVSNQKMKKTKETTLNNSKRREILKW
jgi:hypothetical protein